MICIAALFLAATAALSHWLAVGGAIVVALAVTVVGCLVALWSGWVVIDWRVHREPPADTTARWRRPQ